MGRNDREYALVFAGGGTKGAYQVGVWKALHDIGIKITAITGASIGAINGALTFIDDIDKMIEIYENIKITDIMEVSDKIDPNKNLFDIANIRQLLREYAENRGLENTPLRNTINKNIDIDKIYNSDIDFGIITYSFKNRQPLELFKEDIPKEKFVDYLLASSCFPIFKSQKIGGQEYVDGGFYDNAPVNMLIKKGYKNIIIADVEGIGFNQKISDKDVHLRVLSPSEDIGGLFNFNHDRIRKNILIGYLDTMNAFNKMEGNYYFFPQEEFFKMLDEFNLKTIKGLEEAAKLYKMDRYRPYDFDEFISELYDIHQDTKEKYKEAKKKFMNIDLADTVENIRNNEFALCIAMAIYSDRPTGRKLRILQPYIEMVEAMLELEDYME